MNTHRTLAVSAALAILLAASGCASTGNPSTPAASADARATAATTAAFPTGKFRNGDTVAVFNPDGTYLGTTTNGEDWIKGNYALSGNEITLEDTWEAASHVERMGKSCKGIKGRYGWAMAGDVLTATLIEDTCEGRIKGINGTAWTRMP